MDTASITALVTALAGLLGAGAAVITALRSKVTAEKAHETATEATNNAYAAIGTAGVAKQAAEAAHEISTENQDRIVKLENGNGSSGTASPADGNAAGVKSQ